MVLKKRRPLAKSKRDWINPKNIIGGDGLELKKGIRVFPDVDLEKSGDSFKIILWFGEENDGNGKRIEVTELISLSNLEFFPKRKLNVYLPDILNSQDWGRYLEKKVLEIILPYLDLDISFSPDDRSLRNVVQFEIGIQGRNYIGIAHVPLDESLSEVLDSKEE